MNAKPIKCEYCDNDSIGYADRQLQGPFFCKDHEEVALKFVREYYDEIHESLNPENYPDYENI